MTSIPMTNKTRRSSRRGFSLAELMIAIGILAVGMSILASLFPAAIAMNRRTAKDVLGSIICENGVSFARGAFAAGAVAKPNQLATLAVLADDLRETIFDASMCRFPQGDPDSDYGFVMLHRYINADADTTTEEGRQLVTVAYRRRRPDQNQPILFKMLTTLKVGGKLRREWDDEDQKWKYYSTVLRNDLGHFRIGTPVILSATGEFVVTRQIFRFSGTSVDGEKSSYYSKALINRMADNEAWGTQDAPKTGWAVLEGAETNPNREPRYSPAMSTLVTRLSPDWR